MKDETAKQRSDRVRKEHYQRQHDDSLATYRDAFTLDSDGNPVSPPKVMTVSALAILIGQHVTHVANKARYLERCGVMVNKGPDQSSTAGKKPFLWTWVEGK